MQSQLNQYSSDGCDGGRVWMVLLSEMWIVIHHRGNVSCYEHRKHTRGSEEEYAEMTARVRKYGGCVVREGRALNLKGNMVHARNVHHIKGAEPKIEAPVGAPCSFTNSQRALKWGYRNVGLRYGLLSRCTGSL